VPDIFVSYSHENSDFGRHLHTRLTEQKRDVWMDWEDIPPTVEWWNRIRDGILTSDNFVTIISPNSIASPICNLEIAYARQLGKRILPILYSDTDEKEAFVNLVTHPQTEFQRALLQSQDLLAIARDNWNTLAAINWIKFNNSADFEERFSVLLNAIDTDFKYVDEHTRLLVRAIDWNERKRSPSLLLRGDDLGAAEAWQKTSREKSPQLTVMHSEYIAESRSVENKERRRIKRLQTASLLFGVMVVLAILATSFASVTTANALSARAAVEFQATVFSLEQDRSQRLFAGLGIVPTYSEPVAPQSIIATATQLKHFIDWRPVIRVFNTVEMVQVPAGCFFIGDAYPNLNALPVHEICFQQPFWIDLYEVSNGQFNRLNGSAAQEADNFGRGVDFPRTNITWREADSFCRQRGTRLPTEAEWEYAAKGPNNWLYPWGNNYEPDNVATKLTIVGSKPTAASWVGALDMSGNVWEWTSTIYEPYPYDANDGRENRDSIVHQRVLRSGSVIQDQTLVNIQSTMQQENQDYAGITAILGRGTATPLGASFSFSVTDLPILMYSAIRAKGLEHTYFSYWGFRCALSE
jgi:formylglycine-generating enzyme required for sulfatase activity